MTIKYNFFRSNIVRIAMKAFMCRIRRKSHKHMRAVIVYISPMMHNFFRSKIAFDLRFYNQTMLKDIISRKAKRMIGIIDKNISVSIFSSSTFPVKMFMAFIITGVTFKRAIYSSSFFNFTRKSFKFFSAVRTVLLNHGGHTFVRTFIRTIFSSISFYPAFICSKIFTTNQTYFNYWHNNLQIKSLRSARSEVTVRLLTLTKRLIVGIKNPPLLNNSIISRNFNIVNNLTWRLI